MDLYPHNNIILNRGKTPARNCWVQVLPNHPVVELDQFKYLPVCKICKRKDNEEVNNIWKNGKTGIFQFNIFVCFSGFRKKWVQIWYCELNLVWSKRSLENSSSGLKQGMINISYWDGRARIAQQPALMWPGLRSRLSLRGGLLKGMGKGVLGARKTREGARGGPSSVARGLAP